MRRRRAFSAFFASQRMVFGGISHSAFGMNIARIQAGRSTKSDRFVPT
jgi:hypothetical protein